MNKPSKSAFPSAGLSWNIPLMYAITFFQGMVFYAPVASLYRQVRGLSLGQIALIESISFFLSLALELPWGLIADRIGYRLTMILSCLYLSSSPENNQKVLGRCSAFGTAGLLISAGLFTLFIGDNYSLAGFATVISYGIAALLSLAIQEVRLPEAMPRTQIKDFCQLLLSTLKDCRFLLLLVAVALFNETIQAITIWLNQNQYLRCDIPVQAMGIIYLAVSGISLSSAISKQVSDKMGSLTLGAVAPFLSGLMCLLLVWTRSGVLSVSAIVVMSASSALAGPLYTLVFNRQVRTADRATQLSIFAVIMDVTSAGASLAYGRLADYSLSGAFVLGASVCALSGAAILACRKYFIPDDYPGSDSR